MRRLWNESITGNCYIARNKVETVIEERRQMMMSRYVAGLFMIVLVVGVVWGTVQTVGFSSAEQLAQPAAEEAMEEAPRIYQQTDPNLLVPESTMRQKPIQDPYNWDDNPVAYIPESTMYAEPGRYAHNWDDNPVAYIPESTMYENSSNTASER